MVNILKTEVVLRQKWTQSREKDLKISKKNAEVVLHRIQCTWKKQRLRQQISSFLKMYPMVVPLKAKQIQH